MVIRHLGQEEPSLRCLSHPTGASGQQGALTSIASSAVLGWGASTHEVTTLATLPASLKVSKCQQGKPPVAKACLILSSVLSLGGCGVAAGNSQRIA